MKHWKIIASAITDTYVTVTDTSILITEQPKNTNIDELIVSKKMCNVKTIKYNDVKEIVFIDSDYTIDFIFNDDNTPLETYTMNNLAYREIKSHLKERIKGAESQEYSVFKQITPQLSVLGISGFLLEFIYYYAIRVENGEIFRGGGRIGIFKKIMASIAGILGTTGTLILGILIIFILIYFIIRKIQNPKKGEVLKL